MELDDEDDDKEHLQARIKPRPGESTQVYSNRLS